MIAREGNTVMGGIFRISDTKICLYVDRNDPVKKVKLRKQKKEIMVGNNGMNEERMNNKVGLPLIGARIFMQSNMRESGMNMNTNTGSW